MPISLYFLDAKELSYSGATDKDQIQIFSKDKKVIKRAVELLNEEKLSYETELAENKEREARGDGDLKGIGKEIETILARLSKFLIRGRSLRRRFLTPTHSHGSIWF